MEKKKSEMSLVEKVYKETFSMFKNNSRVLQPFLIFALIELSALIFVYLIPRAPLSHVFGPIVRTFWGERFLHYPANFLLLPKLASLSRMFLSILFGSLLTAMAVSIVSAAQHKKNIGLRLAFKACIKKYLLVFALVLITTILLYLCGKLFTFVLMKYFLARHAKLLFFGPTIWFGPVLLCFNFLVAILVQSLFAYAIPAIIIGNSRFIKAIGESFILFKKFSLTTLIIVGLPLVIYIPIAILNSNSLLIIEKSYPEVILIVAVFSTGLTSLVIDPLVTVATSILYLTKKD